MRNTPYVLSRIYTILYCPAAPAKAVWHCFGKSMTRAVHSCSRFEIETATENTRYLVAVWWWFLQVGQHHLYLLVPAKSEYWRKKKHLFLCHTYGLAYCFPVYLFWTGLRTSSCTFTSEICNADVIIISVPHAGVLFSKVPFYFLFGRSYGWVRWPLFRTCMYNVFAYKIVAMPRANRIGDTFFLRPQINQYFFLALMPPGAYQYIYDTIPENNPSKYGNPKQGTKFQRRSTLLI